ncbi:hypothetical protein [Acidithiobacillus caldus]|uniref:hypothetical protein n=1 Tax=Acidithiobacillus caldus TaxID=33059 RepID=UPI001C073705|nr:hypothetical protein [Acidithiobacillus caldus]MBU2771593.1 hypothetical protein [Acidithiobacillus caldus]
MGKLARINARRKAMGLPVDNGNYRRNGNDSVFVVKRDGFEAMDEEQKRHLLVGGNIVYITDRAEVDSMNIGPTLKFLEHLSASTDAVRAYCGRLNILFNGCDTDPREVWEIPEVRKYFAKLTEAWPYWLWFMNKSPVYSQIPLLTFLLLDGQTLRRGANRWYVFSQPDDVLDLLKNHGHSILELLHGFDIPFEAGIDVLSAAARQIQSIDRRVQSLLAGQADWEKAIFH